MKLPDERGTGDRIIRIVLGARVVAIAVGGSVEAPLLAVAWLVAAIALVTGAIGFCPLYFVLGISTAGNRFAVVRRAKA